MGCKRLASTLAITGRGNGFTPADRKRVVRSSVRAYLGEDANAGGDA